MKIWKHYDKDKSGYLEITPGYDGQSEFKRFLADLLEILFGERPIEDELQTITDSFIRAYDVNRGEAHNTRCQP